MECIGGMTLPLSTPLMSLRSIDMVIPWRSRASLKGFTLVLKYIRVPPLMIAGYGTPPPFVRVADDCAWLVYMKLAWPAWKVLIRWLSSWIGLAITWSR